MSLMSVNASGLFVYIWSISVADVGVILVGDSISWVRPSSVIVVPRGVWFQQINIKIS